MKLWLIALTIGSLTGPLAAAADTFRPVTPAPNTLRPALLPPPSPSPSPAGTVSVTTPTLSYNGAPPPAPASTPAPNITVSITTRTLTFNAAPAPVATAAPSNGVVNVTTPTLIYRTP